ncbi:hypothetical protein VNO77_05198 [Canavalia gladiata]|uniref:Uncharacterized protein n=1 Tax=Canavalia gladiata TaxID=3824 RepID=A0AAN9N3L5_CANGL
MLVVSCKLWVPCKIRRKGGNHETGRMELSCFAFLELRNNETSVHVYSCAWNCDRPSNADMLRNQLIQPTSNWPKMWRVPGFDEC